MREWSRDERYRVLQSADEIKDLHERISKSVYRQLYHVQPVTGLSSDPTTDLPKISQGRMAPVLSVVLLGRGSRTRVLVSFDQ